MNEPIAKQEVEAIARISPDGLMLLSEKIMDEFVIETVGVDLWFNEKDQALGLKLLRGVAEPPYPILRRSGPQGQKEGLVDIGGFLRRVGYQLPTSHFERSCRYYPQYHLMEIRLRPPDYQASRTTTGVLDDFPALED